MMSSVIVYQCQCEQCQSGADHPDQVRHQHLNHLMSQLNERQRRWLAALEAERYGHGGVRLLSQITGLDAKTIRRGQQELAEGLAQYPHQQVRQAGGGRPPVEKKARRRDGVARPD